MTSTTEYADFLRNLNVNITGVSGIADLWNFHDSSTGVSGSNNDQTSFIFGL